MKTNYFKNVLGIAFLLVVGMSYGQQQAQYSLYKFNPLIYNSAYAGTKGTISGDVIHRSQWVGIEGAPSTQSVTFHMPISQKNIGVGGSVFHDRIGSTNTTSINADFAYQMRLNSKKDMLSLGIKAGADLFNSNFLELNVNDVSDLVYTTNIASRIMPNVGFGALFYNEDKYFIGITAQRLLESKILNQGIYNESVLSRHFYLMGGYKFDLNENVEFQPHTQIKLTMGAPISMDVNMDFIIKEKIMIGGVYRLMEGVGLNFMLRLAEYYRLGYGFNYSTTRLANYNYGSHEVMIGFDINHTKVNTQNPRFF